MNSSFDIIKESAPLFIKGALMTFYLWSFSSFISFSLGTLFGIISSRKLRLPIISNVIDWILFVLRAVPYYVQLLIIYFAIPSILNLNLSPFAAGVVSLGICSSAYVSQIIRAGINGIDQGQWDAGFVLGYSNIQILKYIILPQVIRLVLPAFFNELDAILKSTAIISSIGLIELTRTGMNIIARHMNPFSIYLTIAFGYLLISGVLYIIACFLERRFEYARR